MIDIIQAIIDAEKEYGYNHVDVIIDYNHKEEEKVFIMYHDSHNSFTIKVFDYSEEVKVKEDVIENLCDYLDLGFDNYL